MKFLEFLFFFPPADEIQTQTSGPQTFFWGVNSCGENDMEFIFLLVSKEISNRTH